MIQNQAEWIWLDTSETVTMTELSQYCGLSRAELDELVDYYRAIAGEHPDWDDYRKVMVSDKRVMVRLKPTHAYGMLSG